MRVLLPILFCIVLSASAAASTKPGEAMPDFAVNTLDGRNLHAGNLANKVLIVHFWATWCSACQTEMPALERFYQKHRQEGLEVVAISLDDARDRAKVTNAARDYSFASALKDDCRVDAFGRIWVLPLTFVIDRRGILRVADWTGKEHIDDALLAERLLPLLRE
ncbi:MAG: TlpA disulfide reductase family protein [Thiobacillaceae bacterium]